jgi:hypothetical protein
LGAIVGNAGARASASVGKAETERRVVEWYDTDLENAYWRETYESCVYFDPNTSYDEIQPAYRYGWEMRIRHVDKDFEEAEPTLVAGWERARAHSRLTWPQARSACRDAWGRIDRAMRQNGKPANRGRM